MHEALLVVRPSNLLEPRRVFEAAGLHLVAKAALRVAAALSVAQVSFDDPLAPVNPCYYCTSCFNMMHVDASGARVKPEVKIIDSPTGA